MFYRRKKKKFKLPIVFHSIFMFSHCLFSLNQYLKIIIVAHMIHVILIFLFNIVS